MATATQTIKKEENKMRGIVDKVIVNAGVGKLAQQPNFEDKVLPQVEKDLASLSGQKAQVTRAKKSIASFKTRQGQIIGLRITLRGQKMVDFLERLVRIVLPRVHDFRGLNEDSVDKGGVLNIGFKEQDVFPEINPEESQHAFSLGVNIVPKDKDRAKAIEAYKGLGFPFRK
jgi:large subunit ribosomal protein L5